LNLRQGQPDQPLRFRRFCQSRDRLSHPIEQRNSPHGTVRHPPRR
jgi:hypothetical protein